MEGPEPKVHVVDLLVVVVVDVLVKFEAFKFISVVLDLLVLGYILLVPIPAYLK